MNCELCRSETYAWRPNEPVEGFQEMFAHIGSCPECSSIFAGLSRIGPESAINKVRTDIESGGKADARQGT
jgi:hypothetical protein